MEVKDGQKQRSSTIDQQVEVKKPTVQVEHLSVTATHLKKVMHP